MLEFPINAIHGVSGRNTRRVKPLTLHVFYDWIESLPYSELIIGEKNPFSALSPMLEPGYAYAQNECVNPDVGRISDQVSKDDLEILCETRR